MADVVKNEVIRLADIELETAIERFGLNHSNHESFAVLREEIDEATEETNNVNYLSTRVWELTKKNASHISCPRSVQLTSMTHLISLWLNPS